MQINPLTNFCERDLVELACTTGFKDVHMELHIAVNETPSMPWATFLALSPHPWAPTADELFVANFTPDERKRVEATI